MVANERGDRSKSRRGPICRMNALSLVCLWALLLVAFSLILCNSQSKSHVVEDEDRT